MNTILTDDEINARADFGHGQSWRDFARAIEAAVLAKLREQEPKGLIEAVDRVLEEAHCDCPQRLRFDDGQHLSGCPLFDLNVARLEMLAAPLPAVVQVPQGWKLVPVEPTDKMVQAAHHLDLSYMPGQEGADRAAIYRAMLAAAPAEPSRGATVRRVIDDALGYTPATTQTREQWLAVREGHFNAAAEEYFSARPHLDTPENRRVFYAGHCKGYDAAPEAPATDVVQVPRIDALWGLFNEHNTPMKTRDAVLALLAAPEAPAQPSVPAPWREAVKVAREALDWCVAEINRDSPAVKNARPVIAQLDALEGGE